MSKIENRSSHDGWISALKDYQFLILAAVILIGIFIGTLKATSDDLKNHEILKLEYITNEQSYEVRKLNSIIETQQIIIKRQQMLIEQMNSILNKLAPPEPIDPDKWT